MGDGIETTRTAVVDGVRVRKTIDTRPEETGVVTLDVTVERDEPTTVRITEPALGSIPRDEIELHTDHGAEYWHVGEDATFERGFDAGESYEVLYRVTDVDPDRFDELDEDPIVEPVSSSIDDLVSRDDSDVVRELIGGERESLAATAPGAGDVELSRESDVDADPVDGHADDPPSVPSTASSDGPDEGSSTEEIPVDASPEEISVGVPSASESADADEAASEPPVDGRAGGDADDGEPPADAGEDPGDNSASDDLDASLAATPSGGVARVLLKELREGHVDDEIRDELRAELEPGRSRDVRIQHLQSQVTEFAAYVEMLDGFVDEHGTLEAVVDGMDEEIETLDDAVGAVRSELDGLSGTVDEDVGALETDVDDLRDGQGDLGARIDRLEAELETIDDRLDEFDEFRQKLSGAFQGVGDSEP